MPFTTRGLKLLLSYAFRAAAAPAHYYLALVTNGIPPTGAIKTLSELTEVAAGHGYVSGGIQYSPNSTDFNALIEDDTNHWALLGLKNVSWQAVGGDIPISGSPPAHLVLTTDESTVASRQVLKYWSLLGDRLILSGSTLSLTGIEARIQGGSVIKQIQRGTITITGSTSSNTATITAVDTAKSTVELLGVNSSSSSDGWESMIPRISLTNSTTVTVTRGVTTALTGTLSFNYQVVEYY